MEKELKEQIESILNRVYKGEYDFHVARVGNSTVMAHYEKLVVTNHSKKKKTTIRDVFIRFFLDQEGRLRDGFEVARTTLTPQEAESGYCVSHGGGIGQFNLTCIGSGPLVNLQRLNAGKPFNPKAFEAFLIAIKAHLEYEAGGYIQVQNVTEGKFNLAKAKELATVPTKEEMDRIEKEILKQDVSSLLKIEIKSKVSVSPTNEFELELGRCIFNLFGEDTKKVCFKTLAGVYIPIVADRDVSLRRFGGSDITFKGKNYKIKIANLQEDEKREQRYVANPKITKLICKRLEKRIVQRIASRKKAGAGGARGNNAKTAKSNKASVQAGSRR